MNTETNTETNTVGNGAHILVVTGDNYDGVDERTFAIVHVGPVGDCATWVPCPPENPCHGQDYDPETSTTDYPVFHGVEHMWMYEEQEWAVRGEPAECFYASEYATGQIQDLAVDMQFPDPAEPGTMPAPLYAGRYAITPYYQGDGEFDLDVDRRIPTRVQVTGALFNGRVPDGAVYVGRRSPYMIASEWANPFKPGRATLNMVRIGGQVRQQVVTLAGAVPPDVETAVGWYQVMIVLLGLEGQIRAELAGRDLACWCKDGPCHADVLLQIANPDESLLAVS